VEKIFKHSEQIETSIKKGDIIEIEHGVFIRVNRVELVTEENLAGTKKTNVYLKGEIISNGRQVKRF